MAIPNNYIDKIKDKDSGEIRPICPPAEHVQVDNENFEGETLDEVLGEVARSIDEAGQGGYAPPEGGIPKTDLAKSVQDSLDAADSALQDEDVAEVAKTGDYNDLEHKPTIPDTSNLATKTELNAKQDKISAGNGIVIAQDGKTVSVDAEVVQPVTADGTFTIRIGNNIYTINLNHEHQGMAKLAKFVASNPPASMANDTIYAQVDNLTTPTEIQSLWLFGCEFAGGYDPGTPRLTSPSQTQIKNGIDIGNTTSGVATYSLNIKAKDITQSLLVEWGNGSTGYSFNTSNLPTGVTYDSGTGKLTITKEAATAINGVDIPVVYTGSDTDENAEGALGISSSSVDGISVEVTLVANKVTYTDLAAVKLTGTQWLQTDYYPNPNTEWNLECKLTDNARTYNSAGDGSSILRCYYEISSAQRFTLHTSTGGSDYFAYSIFYLNKAGSNSYQKEIEMRAISTSEMVADHAVLSYVKGTSSGTLTFNGGTPRSVATELQTETLTTPMCIGYRPDQQKIFNVFDLTIYEFTITENGTAVRHWVPKLRNGVPGLYDTVNHTFISSETATELVAIPLT